MTALPILFADDHVAVVSKPSGMLVHRGWGDDGVVAMTLARDALGRHVHPVHRLDRGTSGALVFALSKEAASALGEAFASGGVSKRYIAFTRGAPGDVVVDSPVPRGETGPKVDAVTALRTLAVVSIEGIGRDGAARDFAVVDARPRTGRLHQIRRHLKHVGHPIVGDANYGRGEINRFFRERYGLARLALHAIEVAFPHPVTGTLVEVLAPLPDDLAGPLARAGVAPSIFEGFRSEASPA